VKGCLANETVFTGWIDQYGVNLMNKDLFQYQIRVSSKAKNSSLKVTFQHGLEVVIPRGYDQRRVPGLLSRNKEWIKAALERVEMKRKCIEPEPEWQLPTDISLPAIGQKWHLESRESNYASVGVREVTSDHLLIFGKIGNDRACMKALHRWLLRRAKDSIVPILEKISARTGLHFNRVSIKGQRTRWASCSQNRSISLNAKLLFLEPDLVEYCMVHELCHVEHMNHSKNFWSLVQHYSPNYREQDRRLRDAWKTLPRWMHYVNKRASV
jgi:predicted metal-dependent hydrolase